MKVLKFGGTSVANAENMAQCVKIITQAVETDRVIVVGSAISGCTDTLINIANLAANGDESYKQVLLELQNKHHTVIETLLPAEKQAESLKVLDATFDNLANIAKGVFLLGELTETSLDAIQGCGELLSTRILATKLASKGIATKWVDSRSIIKTYRERGKTVVDQDTTFSNVWKMLEDNPGKTLFVVPGFIGSDAQGRMTTLGRGGSDFSASLYAVGSKARALETWKDVPGMMTSNPKIAPAAQPIHHISYRAALELSHFGAKVIYPPTIQPAVKAGIPIYVKCTFDPSAEGTLIEQNPPRSKNKLIGISNSDKIALISLEGSGMVDVPGISSRLFKVLSDNDINIILITQASSVNTMCVAIAEKDAQKAKTEVDKDFAYEISLGKINPLNVETGYSIVCLVGDDIINQSGTTGRMLDALGRRNIGIRAVAQGSSERNISVIVSSTDVNLAIKYIHNEFFETSSYKDINIFLAGYGTVGKALVDIIASQKGRIAERTGKRLHIAGVSNSRKFVIDPQGIDPAKVAEMLENGCSAADDAFFDALGSVRLQNSVFVDCTASSEICYKYKNLFKQGYSVVACNKIALAAPIEQYKEMKEVAKAEGVSLRYETTVGAALPIVESIARCAYCADEIKSVEAVLSGTLNFLFSTYKGGEDGVSFADVVRKAKELGYSEPDPRLDLSGKDVMRKLLILSREAGVDIDEKDVEVNPLLSDDFFKGSVEDFFKLLDEREAEFAAAYKAAAEKGLKQRFIAGLKLQNGSYKATMGVQTISESHPLYSLDGTDNSAIITTEMYPSPLVVKGAGAGARQTASGVLNDILL